MAKSDARRTKGQAKPGKERGAPGAVRAREDAKTGGGSGAGGGRVMGSICEYCGKAQTDPKAELHWIECPRAWHDKQAIGRTESIGPVGMETGANSGRLIGEGTETKGGERAAGVSDWHPNQGAGNPFAERYVQGGDHIGGLQRAACERATPAWEDGYNFGYASGFDDQDWEAKTRASRKTIAALLIGLTLGLLLPLAYQMVSRG